VPERVEATDHLADCGDRLSRADSNLADRDASPDNGTTLPRITEMTRSAAGNVSE
jgi:hypothetical protein